MLTAETFRFTHQMVQLQDGSNAQYSMIKYTRYVTERRRKTTSHRQHPQKRPHPEEPSPNMRNGESSNKMNAKYEPGQGMPLILSTNYRVAAIEVSPSPGESFLDDFLSIFNVDFKF